jgi:hypothetical protein
MSGFRVAMTRPLGREVHVEENDCFAVDAGRAVGVGLCDCRVSERGVWPLCFENGRTLLRPRGLALVRGGCTLLLREGLMLFLGIGRFEIRRSWTMIRKTMVVLVLLGLLWASGCATESSSSRSNWYGPSSPFSQRDWCGMGAVYCGPGP